MRFWSVCDGMGKKMGFVIFILSRNEEKKGGRERKAKVWSGSGELFEPQEYSIVTLGPFTFCEWASLVTKHAFDLEKNIDIYRYERHASRPCHFFH